MIENRLEKLLLLLQEQPMDSFLRYALSMEYLSQGKQAESRDILEALLRDDPGYLGTYYQLGKLYEEEGREEEALKIFRKGMEVAKSQNATKIWGELKTAVDMLEDF